VFGYALLRTGGLAMPIGLHLGGNWIQSSVFGLGREQGSVLSAASLDAEQIRVLSAPDLMPHVPYLLAMVLRASLSWCVVLKRTKQTLDAMFGIAMRETDDREKPSLMRRLS